LSELRENCGVFGVYSGSECVKSIHLALHFLQHRGQQYCGISTSNGKEIVIQSHKGRVDPSFSREDFENLTGHFGIGHVSLRDRQPMTLHSHIGDFSICFNGNITNAEELIQRLKKDGYSFWLDSQIELLAKLVGRGQDFVEAIASMEKEIEGSYSILILTTEGIYAARDRLGFKPLVLGKKGAEYAVASESRALQNLGFEIDRDVKPGEIVFIDRKGFKSVRLSEAERTAHCAFEWAYTASVDSVIDGLSVDRARNNMGAMLARRDRGKLEADIVAPVPNSGIGHAEGYHLESGIPLKSVFLIDRYGDRSYTQATQSERDKEANNKLSVLKDAVKGKRVVLCDDSIVRGTQIREKVKELKKAGAKEVHVRVACPPLMYPCRFGISTRNYDELIARRMPVEDICRHIEADSLVYNSQEDFVKALNMKKDRLCLYCWDGVKPFKEKQRKLVEEEVCRAVD
jgi:amidophosphoribosyltransferase